MGHGPAKWRSLPASSKSILKSKLAKSKLSFHPLINIYIKGAPTSPRLTCSAVKIHKFIMACKFCNDFDALSYSGGFLVDFSDLQENCRFCSLLRRLLRHFAPSIDDQLKPFLHIDQQEDNVIYVEVAVNDPLEAPGSPKTSAMFYVYNPSSVYPYD